jgi:hypothetical protein
MGRESKKEKMSRSSFIREAVEFYMKQTDTPQIPGEAIQLREENRKLREDLKLRTLALEKAETDLFRAQNVAFLEEPHGRFNLSELIKTLKTGGLWTADKILESLHISPRDVEVVQIISKQLQVLQSVGLVTETLRGWRWKG